MNPLIDNENLNLEDLFSHYHRRIEKEETDILRVKNLYHDDDSFNDLMNKIITKDYKRFEALIGSNLMPNPWRILYVILNIVQYDGDPIEPFDILTKTYNSKTLKYCGWTFSWAHGAGTITSIYNREDELVYRF